VLKFLSKRIGYGLLVLLGVITVVFFLFNVLPGDPARMMLGQRADMASVEAIQKELGLHRPLHIRFLGYVNDLSPVSIHNHDNKESVLYLDDQKYHFTRLIKTGDLSFVIKTPYLGRSYQSNRPVTSVLATAFPNTLLLAIISIGFAMIAGIILGIFSAIKTTPFSHGPFWYCRYRECRFLPFLQRSLLHGYLPLSWAIIPA
jgi:peptide/nickel transport system permease protein